MNLLKREGPLEWFHDENKNISAMQFQFKDKGSPLDYVYRLSPHLVVSCIFSKKMFKIIYFFINFS